MWEQLYIGIPWATGNSDVEGLNCYELLRRCYREQLGIELSPVQADGSDLKATLADFTNAGNYTRWKSQENPTTFDAVLMGRGKQATHVGIYSQMSGGSVIHTVQNAGSMLIPIKQMENTGYKIMGFYRYVAPMDGMDDNHSTTSPQSV